MRPPMSDRTVLIKHFSRRYRACRGKKERGRLLDEFVAQTGYRRSYAALLLRLEGRRVRLGPRVVVVGDGRVRVRRQRQRVYDAAVVRVLVRLWELLDEPCGKRLAPALPRVIEALERHGELQLAPVVRSKLLAIAPATIDRLLAEERRRRTLKSRAKTKPGTLLRHHIPVRTFADWDEARAGFIEVDLAGHDGGLGRGDYIHTLTATDVVTTWTELGTARNKAHVHVFAALRQAIGRMPFPVLGIDCDNGGEFINREMKGYCEDNGITFTRSRPYRKNDNCFVEQKNWSVVRRFIGYARFDTDAAAKVLAQLDQALSDYLNFFMPTMKLIEKVRDGAKVRKRHDTARTPYERVLACPDVDPEVKAALQARAKQLNPAALRRSITDLQKTLQRLATPTPPTPPPSRAVDGAGLRKAGPQPSAPTFPQPLENPPPPPTPGFPTPPTAPTTGTPTHAFR